MGRLVKHNSNAAKQAAYRERRRQAGLSTGGSSNLERLEEWRIANPDKYKLQRRRTSKQARQHRRETRMFIAIDGEGITNPNNLYRYETGEGKKKKYKDVPSHHLGLLGSSTGNYIENYNGLSTEACLEFLLNLAGAYSNSILVGFYFNYDANMILKDLSEDEAKELWQNGELELEGYHITWLHSKIFGCNHKESGRSFCLYDVSGFFQKSFIRALEDNKIDVPEEIKEGKLDRTNFFEKSRTKKGRDEIRYYNKLECDLLVTLMNQLRNQMIACGFLPDKWHGAGAIASTILKRYNIAEHNYTPFNYKQEIISAYFGGRNQMLTMGEIGDCWIHDINSAYPAAMRTLPTGRGVWIEESRPDKREIVEWGLHYVKWKIKEKKSCIMPFPFRAKNNRIYWTKEGEGWYWTPEVFAAKEQYGSQIKILRTIQFYPESDELPFDFINNLYLQRQYLVSIGDDAQLPLKLGLNSLYGKVAQGIGYKTHKPRYTNYFWAGYITSQTRATMFNLAQKNPKEIVFFATDGVVSRSKLIESDEGKPLGGWDVKELTNFFALQSGVYCFDSNERKYKSRGFNYRSVDYDKVRQMWKAQGIYGQYSYKETRFIGLGIALATDFNLWGRWLEQDRELNFMPIGEFNKMEQDIWLSIPILPPSIEEEVSCSYKPKGEWWESENDKEYLSLLDNSK